LRDGEQLPDVIELEAMTDVDKLQLAISQTADAPKGVPSTGRTSIGKTSLQAAAKVSSMSRCPRLVHCRCDFRA
jgi:hypothetical protein